MEIYRLNQWKKTRLINSMFCEMKIIGSNISTTFSIVLDNRGVNFVK